MRFRQQGFTRKFYNRKVCFKMSNIVKNNTKLTDEECNILNTYNTKEEGQASEQDELYALYESMDEDTDGTDQSCECEEDPESHLQYMIDHVKNEYESTLLYKIHAAVVPGREENIELAMKAQSGDEKAMEDLIIRNGRLVTKYLTRFGHLKFGVQEDLLQEGLLGIQRAAVSFDPSAGNSFSTYAMFWIRQKMVRYVQSEYESVRFPVHIEEKRLHIRKLQSQYNEPLSREEIAEKLDISIASVNMAMEGSRTISLNEKISHEHTDDKEMTFLDTLRSNENMVSDTENKTANPIIMELLNRYLTETEKDILMKRFGFYDGIPHTLQEVADTRGISRERVRQLQKRAIGKLRVPFKKRDMSAFFNICV